MNRDSFADGEWYHCYNRGVDKRETFMRIADYDRMQELFYLGNSHTALHRSNRARTSHVEVFTIPRGDPLVRVAAYCLMPNHFHLLVRQERTNGISTYMRKVMTAYTMYFNIKYNRDGNLFYKPFRSRHIHDDRYGQHVYNYIRVNPWEVVRNESNNAQIKFLERYSYSSLIDGKTMRAESAILAGQYELPFVNKPTQTILCDAQFFDENSSR